MGFQKKNEKNADVTAPSATQEGTKVPRGNVDSRRLTTALGSVREVKDQLETVEKGLLERAAEVATIEEDRRREGETFSFNLRLERDKQKATIAKEDEAREAAFTSRDQTLTAGEKEFAHLTGVTLIDNHLDNGKNLRAAFETKLAAARADGEAAGKAVAMQSYGIQKRIDDANAKGALDLLNQKNAHLEAANVELKSANLKLMETQALVNATVADVAKTGLNAAAGVVSQGNQALGNAAGTVPGGSRTGR